ncbi:MAG: xanthine dehydrogenase family protein molybdopterin-binding subunit [Candidatus Eremiobacteraeota bacterium]|nr:xanthine dehydrogenase family protein molybdopterin-binding subunit [Candidatus Eremiobacteraeota bacterium]
MSTILEPPIVAPQQSAVGTAVGRPVSRVDGPAKVKGAAQFAAEVPVEGLTYATIVSSTIARGRIATLDTSAASTAPGVVYVMTHENAPKLQPPVVMMSQPRAAGASDLPIMQDAEIHWNGEPIAVVLAETQEQADYAASLVRATYEREPSVLDFTDAKASPRSLESVLGEPPVVENGGDAEAALREAAVVVDRTYVTPRHNHCAIELHAATVVWEGDKLTVHDATQMLGGTQWTIAGIFGIDEANVRILSPFVGGGFGGKGLWSHQILAIAAARESGRPVRIVLSRESDFRLVGGRTTTEQRVALGANPDGTLAALIHTGHAAMTPHNNCPEQFTFPARHLYAAKALRVAQDVVDIDMIANTFMRAPGESIGTFALETAMDELAEKLELDPIELRKRLEPEVDPASGRPFSSRHLIEAYERGAEAFGWERGRKPRTRRDGEWLVGHGVATATYPYFRMPGGSARVVVSRDGSAVVQIASHEMGMGTATAQAQFAADHLGLPLERVRFEYGDTNLPPGTIAGGSSQSASIIAAVIASSAALIDEFLNRVPFDSLLSGLKASDVAFRDGGLYAKHEPGRGESYVTMLTRAGRDEIAAQVPAPDAAEMEQFSMHSYGAQFAEVRVNAVTFETRVTRFLGSFDVGRILNAKTAASQLRGGIVMGIGLALMEDTLFDERSGRIMNPSLAEYHVPVHLDVPQIEVMWTDIPDPQAPGGVHGIGEIGITGVGAAIANAVYNATGTRIYDLPITLDKLLEAETRST